MKTKYFVIGGIALILIIAVANSNNAKTKTVATKPVQQVQQVSQPTTASKIHQWYTQYGSNLTTISSDLTQTSTDATNTDTTAMTADCTKMQADVATAQAVPPIPDGVTEQHWSSALTYLNTGATDCIQGIANNDANQIDGAATNFTLAGSEFTASAKAVTEAQ